MLSWPDFHLSGSIFPDLIKAHRFSIVSSNDKYYNKKIARTIRCRIGIIIATRQIARYLGKKCA